MTAEELARSIAKWVKANTWRESGWATPMPMWLVDSEELLDHIAATLGIDKAVIGKWIDEDTTTTA